MDKDGNRVNKLGYLVDEDGNVVDKRGDMVFRMVVLDKNGEIPLVFRNGLLRQGSTSELSRLMSEIEKNQDSDFEDLMKEEPDEDEKGNTSVDSRMGDTPSNYNIPNQRFDAQAFKEMPKDKYDEQEEDFYEDSEGESIDSKGSPKKRIMRKKKRKKRRKAPKPVYEDPSE